LVSGLATLPKQSARSLTLELTTVIQVKNTSNELIINFPASYQGLAQSILIDNLDTANAVTVRINRGVNTMTIGASDFRAFNDAWIEQLNLTGGSTDTQVTAQVATLRSIMPGAYSGVTN
jgi:hypothetical protein